MARKIREGGCRSHAGLTVAGRHARRVALGAQAGAFGLVPARNVAPLFRIDAERVGIGGTDLTRHAGGEAKQRVGPGLDPLCNQHVRSRRLGRADLV